MQKDMNKVFDATQKELERDSELSKELVKESAKRLLEIKKTADQNDDKPSKSTDEAHHEPIDVDIDIDNWNIEYED